MSATANERWDLASSLKVGDKVVKSLYSGSSQTTSDTLYVIEEISGLKIKSETACEILMDFSSKTSTVRWRVATDEDVKADEAKKRVQEIDAQIAELNQEKSALTEKTGKKSAAKTFTEMDIKQHRATP